MIFLFITSISIGIYFYLFVTRRYKYWESRQVPFIPPKFLQGNLNFWPKRQPLAENIQEWYNAYPNKRYTGIFQLLTPNFLLRDPELIKQVTIKSFDHFVDHVKFLDAVSDPIWAKNLFARNGDEWRTMRSTLSPSFTLSKMRTLFSPIDEVVQNLKNFIIETKATNGTAVVELELKDILSRITNDVIASTAFGLNVNSIKNDKNEFYTTGKELTNFGGLRLLWIFTTQLSSTVAKILKVKVVPTKIGTYFSDIINKAIKGREEQGIVRSDMIQLLVEEKKNHSKTNVRVTNEDIVAQAMIFFFAGFDTVSTAMSFALYELTINPNVQERLFNEIIAENEITYESIQKMPYLDMVLSESLRKWPAVIYTDRLVTKSFTIEPIEPDEKQIHLQKGTNCIIPIFAVHRDPKFYPSPEKFDPERFSNDNKNKIVQGAYIPFGSGPRSCVGNRFALLEMKLVIVNVLKCFQLVSTRRTPSPVVLDPDDAHINAVGGLWIGFKKRD